MTEVLIFQAYLQVLDLFLQEVHIVLKMFLVINVIKLSFTMKTEHVYPNRICLLHICPLLKLQATLFHQDTTSLELFGLMTPIISVPIPSTTQHSDIGERLRPD